MRSDPPPLLFTPGPLTTSASVKQAMLSDWGSRDARFLELVRGIRHRLVALAGGSEPDYQAVPIQGSGTFGIESVIGSSVPRDGKLLVFVNGAYGRRMVAITGALGIRCSAFEVAENRPISPDLVRRALSQTSDATHAAVVHCETTTGLINPVENIIPILRSGGCRTIVDAMSSFGGVPLDLPACGIDFLVSSSNKCIQGVPGFSFVIARRDALEECRGRARSVSLDLHAQWCGLEGDGQFRFTPPTHVVAAFAAALDELATEGGVAARARRYRANCDVLLEGMKRLGFEPFLGPHYRGWIITSFRYPNHPNFNFEIFYRALAERGYIIYPGKLSTEDCFRIGSIGHLFPSDLNLLVKAVADVLESMNVPVLACTEGQLSS